MNFIDIASETKTQLIHIVKLMIVFILLCNSLCDIVWLLTHEITRMS
jgi:hypothetical protein